MKISDIILSEDASAMATTSADMASVAFPLFGKKKMIRRAVDPKGYLGDGKPKNVGYVHPVKPKGKKK